MKIFITGIAGFIGFHLARSLKERGNEVIGCDNFNAYYDPSLKRRRAARLTQSHIPILEIDICTPHAIEKAVTDYGITHFVHLAAQAGVRHSLTHPESYVDTNLNGFVHVLEACKNHPAIKFIYASSSSVYGCNEKIPFSEEDFTDRPVSLYGATKKANEVIAHSYHHVYGLHVTGLRYFTVYGPWGRPDMAYYSFTKAILEEKSIALYNHGHMQRDFTYIEDIVRGTIAAIDLGAPCELFNLGNNKAENLIDMIRLIETRTGKKAQMQYLPMQSGDVPITYADITKSKRLLNYAPEVSLEEGILRFVEWYTEVHSKVGVLTTLAP